MIYELLMFGGVYFFGVLVGWTLGAEDVAQRLRPDPPASDNKTRPGKDARHGHGTGL